MLDSDIIVKPNVLQKLLSHNKDIVSGLYFNYFNFSGEIVLLPVCYVSPTEEEFEKLKKGGRLPPGAKTKESIKRHLNKQDVEGKELLEVHTPSAGCLLVSKNVLHSGARYGSEIVGEGETTSDEIYFFNRLREKGFKFYCDPSVLCKHLTQEKFFSGEHPLNE
jgi:hypothetical protein